MNSSSPPAPDGVPTLHIPVPAPATQYVSFLPDDLPDNPLGPGECIVWFEGEYIDLFDWPEFRTDDPDDPTPHFLDDLPDSTSPSEQHQWLESQGFGPDDSMKSFTHSALPCPLHHSSSHALFARWSDGTVYPQFFDQKTAEKVDYSAVFRQSDLELDVDLPASAQDPDGDDPASDSPAAWAVVSSIAELRELPRFIVVRNKRPLAFPNEGHTELMASSPTSLK